VADELDQVRSRIDIVDLIGQRQSLKKAGKHWKGLCPFHDDRDPSMIVNRAMGRYKCWACGASGDIFNWVMETQRVDFKEALRILADQAGVEIRRQDPKKRSEREEVEKITAAAQSYFRAELGKSQAARDYLEQRGIDKQTQDEWGIGYAPDTFEGLTSTLQKKGFSLQVAEAAFLAKPSSRGNFIDIFRGRVIVPIKDERGRLIAFGGRILGDGQPKYINSSDTPIFRKGRILYGLDRAKDVIAKAGYAILVEGYMDVIACRMAGVENSVANLGTAFTEEHAGILKRWCTKVVILYDRDTAGQKAAMKTAEILLEAGVKPLIAMPPEGEDPDSLLQRDGAKAVQELVASAVTPTEQRIQLVKEKFSPADDEYWNEIAEALAMSSSPMELERCLEPLAVDLPGVSDRSSAQAMLRRMAAKAKRKMTAERKGRPASEPVPERKKPARISGLESTVLRSLIIPALAKQAWELLEDNEMFHSPAAKAAAMAVRTEFPDAAPDVEPSIWVNRLAEEVAELLMQAEGPDSVELSSEHLASAAKRLKAKSEARSRQAMVETATGDDEALQKLNESLRKAHKKTI
jgi:DNA primase